MAVVRATHAEAQCSYDPHTGKELWRVEERGQHSASTRPVIGRDMGFYPTGFANGQLFAVRTGGKRLITHTHVAWKVKLGRHPSCWSTASST